MLYLKIGIEFKFAPCSSCSCVCRVWSSSSRAARFLSRERTSSAFGEAGLAVGDELPERERELSVSPLSAPRSPAVVAGCGEGAWAAASRGAGDARLRRWSLLRMPSSSSSFVAHCTLYFTSSTERERERVQIKRSKSNLLNK